MHSSLKYQTAMLSHGLQMHLPQHPRKLSSISCYWCCLQTDRACSISDSVICSLCDTFESSFSEGQLFYWEIKNKSNTVSVLRSQWNCLSYMEVESLLIMENMATRQYVKKSEYVVQSFIPFCVPNNTVFVSCPFCFSLSEIMVKITTKSKPTFHIKESKVDPCCVSNVSSRKDNVWQSPNLYVNEIWK